MKATLIAFLILCAGTAFGQNLPAAGMSLNRDSLRIGEQTNIEIEFVYMLDAGVKPSWPPIGKTMAPEIEVLSTSDIDTVAVDADQDPFTKR
jgi:hypothetical protein